MKSSIIIASACATLALANPVVQRDIKTEVVFEYVTVTVTGTGPSPTAVVAVETTPAAADVPEATTDATTDTTTDANTGNAGAFFSATSDDQQAAPETVQQSVAAPSAPAADLSGYAAPILEQHNIHRARHSAPALEWDDNLANIASTIAQSCIYAHKTNVGGGGYGQNIAVGVSADQVGPQAITQMMYDGEEPNYTYYGGEPNTSTFGDWGHFTQIVWASTTKVGCATITCPVLYQGNSDGSAGAPMGNGIAPIFTVCNYGPPGNMAGAYTDNVRAPQ